MKALKIMILFIVLLSGCSQKYLDSREEELLDRKILSTWKILDANVVEQNDRGFSLNLQIKDLIEVKDSLNVKEIYKRGYKRKDGSVKPNYPWNCFEIGGGCVISGFSFLMGMTYIIWSAENYTPSYQPACVMGGLAGTGLGGLFFIGDGFFQLGYKSSKMLLDRIQTNTICVDSVLLSKNEIKIMDKDTDFEKMYLTDIDGNIKIKFDEIIPEPTEADSVLNLIIQYEEMVDSVKIKGL